MSKRSQYVVYLQAVTKFDRAISSATSPPKCCRASPKSSRPLRLGPRPQGFKRLLSRPEDTAAAIDPEGWFNTRDLARLENGYLFIVGRTKELIVRFCENVYPAEVEAVLNSHPAVIRSAVIGRTVEGAEGGVEVVAFVQLAPSAPTSEAELAQHAAQHLAPYKRPSQILLVPSMPLTLTGKVVKAELAKTAPFAPIR